MGAFKRSEPALRFGGDKITADEMDITRQYVVLHPSVGTAYFGTAASASPVAVTVVQGRADYPRNLAVSILGVAGGMGGTTVINGKDQFGNVIQESFGFGTAAGGGTAVGTKVFAEVTSGTATPVGLGGTAVGSVYVGVATGTSATSPIFGLPDRLGGTSDVKSITWIDADVAKQHGAASVADVTNSAVILNVAGGIAAADSFVVSYRSTFVAEDTVNNL